MIERPIYALFSKICLWSAHLRITLINLPLYQCIRKPIS
ncbi:hypothetical protein RSAG8_01839, partial [Rhizoctonia solani AG-8 WAC10335]